VATTITYPAVTQIESALTFNSNASTQDALTVADGFGRQLLVQRRQAPGSSNFDTVQTSYDSAGRPYRISQPFVATAGQTSSTAPHTDTTFDAVNRPLQTVDAGGGTVSYSYAQNDVLITVGPAPTGESTKKRQLEYDGLGRLKSVCEVTSATGSGSCGQSVSATGYLTQYTYDALDRLAGVTQNAQAQSGYQTRTFTYDGVGRLTSEANPETGTTNYTYDTNTTCGTSTGDLVKRVDAVGNTTCYGYDVLHRVTSITYPSGSYASATPEKHFVYDSATVNSVAMSNAKGRLAEAYTGASGNKITDLGFSYTARGETADVYQKSPNSGGYYHLTGTYWEHGALKTLSGLPVVPTLTYNVDGEGRVSSVSGASGTNPVTNVAYDTSGTTVGSLTGITYGATVSGNDSDAFTFSSTSFRPATYQFNVGSQNASGALTWNANGSLQQLAIADGTNSANTQTCNYAYDDHGRIKTADCGTKWYQDFSTTDVFGNVKKTIGTPPGTSFTPTYDNSNHISGGGYSTSYDANGNITNDGMSPNPTTYTWDVDGFPHTIARSSTTTTVVYDALGRAVENQSGSSYTQVVYGPGGNKLGLMNGSSLVKAFIPLVAGAQAVYDSAGLKYYRHPDWLGTSRLASAPNRTLYFSGAYAPYGEDYAKTTGNIDLSFTGQNQDTISGLYDFMYRRYNPVQGRWISPDPAGMAAVDLSNPQSWNRYAYVMNSPTNWIDPLGLVCSAEYGGGDTECNNANSGGGGGSGGGFWSWYIIESQNWIPNPVEIGTDASGTIINFVGISEGGHWETSYSYWPIFNAASYYSAYAQGVTAERRANAGGLNPSQSSQAAMVAIKTTFNLFPNICTYSLSGSVSLGPVSFNVTDTQNGTTAGFGGTVKLGNLVRVTGGVNSKGDPSGMLRYGGLFGVAMNPDTGLYGAYAGKIVSLGEGFKVGASITATGRDMGAFYCGKP
jgi:RHS repeat-associated protein